MQRFHCERIVGRIDKGAQLRLRLAAGREVQEQLRHHHILVISADLDGYRHNMR